ncbi:MAG: glutamate formimidoyltransferase [Candidatus Latescibacterota bacterium]|nr:MAG: glutamate formimidoyltransferase [Candidatus Latescibacterota bacterium]
MALVECVPNISEGRDRAVIDAVVQAAEKAGVTVLDVDPGAATNRTVITFVGSPEQAVQGAFLLIAKAAELIDMSKHRGEHPRMGATDVCPFIPISGATMQDCAELARKLGRRVGGELGIPVYLYEYAASKPERRNLAWIRAGEYEALAENIKKPDRVPDFGKPVFHPRAGATVIGARKFLIAYNVNLNTLDKKLAHDIALNIREAGRSARGEDGKILKDADGNAVKTPGLFPHVKAVGWVIEEYKRAQISINFTDWEVSPPHLVFDEVCRQAMERGMRVTGSELVGLIPKNALLAAGEHYLRRQGRSHGVPEPVLLETAIQSLGLSDLYPFKPEEKIIEYRVAARMGTLASKRVFEFADEVSTESPAPGGGSVAALVGALGAALAAMVANLTVGKKGHEKVWGEMSDLAARAQELKDFFLRSIDEDTRAFSAVLEASRLPKGTKEEAAARGAAVESAMKNAALVPLRTLERTEEVAALAAEAADKGNPASISDAAVAALSAEGAAEGAWFNVIINIGQIGDAAFVQETRKRADAVLERVRARSSDVRDRVRRKLEGNA